MKSMSYDCFSNGLLRKKIAWATSWATLCKTRFAGRCRDARRQHDASIVPKRLSEILSESARQATRDRIGAPPPAPSGFFII
jgi:hypothetical protein